jgi:hypothetical protein
LQPWRAPAIRHRQNFPQPADPQIRVELADSSRIDLLGEFRRVRMLAHAPIEKRFQVTSVLREQPFQERFF